MSKRDQLSRRQFMGKSAVAGAAVPLYVSSSVLAQPGKPGANDRIQVGLIGAGGMGRGNLRNCTKYDDVVVTGICEVWKERRDTAIAEHDGKPKPYNDYRELLQQKDVDAVIIASP
ncbi:MAG: Gfo/Idh/MocA family oxidoreductase, partial [Planctomycetes bacterium]|nr:Gfo/Idh/MocA family oxidoreductase [Planctomycetota bacterium]